MPLVIDLFCGLGGWSKGFLSEGWDAIGFDLERHDYGWKTCPGCDGTGNFYRHDVDGDFLPCDCMELYGGDRAGTVPSRYPGQLVLQDVLTIHGSQFRHASCIVASPPCQRYSYMAMPWKRSKALIAWHKESPERVKDLNALFDACFRIQIEASKAAGRYIPLVVENVKGAQPWVGRAKAHYGSYYLWGDVEDVGGRIVAKGPLRFGMPSVKAGRAQKHNPDGTQHGTGSWFAIADSKNRGAAQKNGGGSWFNIAHNTESGLANNPVSVPAGVKVPGMNPHDHEKGLPGRSFQSAAVKVASESGRRTDVGNGVRFTSRDCGIEGVKQRGSGAEWFDNGVASMGSKSNARKAASAAIAEIPFELASYIARAFSCTD